MKNRFSGWIYIFFLLFIPVLPSTGISHYVVETNLVHSQIPNEQNENQSTQLKRKFSVSEYTPGEQLNVSLLVTNAAEKPRVLHVKEKFPADWSITSISHEGIQQENGIEWNGTIPVGETELTYQIIPPLDRREVVFFQCSIENNLLYQSFLNPSYIKLNEPIPGVWRYWTAEDGLAESWTFGVTLTPSENVIAKHGEVSTIEYLNGYKILKQITIPAGLRFETSYVFEGINETLWAEFIQNISDAQYNTGFSVYQNGRWNEYELEAIKKLKVPTDQLSYLVINSSEVLFIDPNGLKKFNINTKETTLIRSSNAIKYFPELFQLEILPKTSILPMRDGSLSVSLKNGFAKIIPDNIDDFSNSQFSFTHFPRIVSPDSKWEYYFYDENNTFETFGQLSEGLHGEIFAIAVHKVLKKSMLIQYLNDHWSVLHVFESPVRSLGFSTEIDAFWLQDNEQIYYINHDKKYTLSPSGKNWVIADSMRSILQYPEFKRMDEEKLLEMTVGPMRGVTQEKSGAFWAWTGSGITRWTKSLWTPPEYLLGEKSLSPLFDDSKGRLWFSHSEEIICLDNNQIFSWKININNFLYFSKDSNGSIWGHDGKKVYRLINDEWKEINLPFKPLGLIHDMYRMSSGHILISFDRVINNKFQNELVKIDIKNNQIIPVLLNHNYGDLYFAGEYSNQLFMYGYTIDRNYNAPGNVDFYTFDGKEIHTIKDFNSLKRIVMNGPRDKMIDSVGNFWIGGMDGVWRYYDGIIEQANPQNGYNADGAYSFLELKNGNIWAGFIGTIFEYANGEWRQIETPAFDNIEGMAEDQEGRIWIVSGPEVLVYDHGNWNSYGKEEGLTETRYTDVLCDRYGRIWVGGDNVYLYNPEADPDPPETYLLDPLHETGMQGNVQFVYSGMDKWKYTPQDRLYFSYSIDKGKWTNYTTQNEASFTNLSPGDHTFEVRARDRNWNEDQSPELWKFFVPLHWYKQPYFIFTSICGFILTLTFAFYAINRHFKLQENYSTLRQTQNQLIQSEKMASLGSLVAGVAHEINNPINFIKSNIQPMREYLLGSLSVAKYIKEKEDTLQDDVRNEFLKLYEKADLDYASKDSDDLLQAFDDGSNRIAQIVADLRQYIRVDAEYKSHVNLHESINSTLNILHNKIKNRVQVHKEFGDIPNVKCSPGQMSQVFMNILSNAADAIEGEGNIWFETKQSENSVIISIRDDGKGIPEKNKTKIFDPFFTTKPVGSGTGLGLSITYTIIDQHNGSITVESAEGKGTTFTITLPINS